MGPTSHPQKQRRRVSSKPELTRYGRLVGEQITLCQSRGGSNSLRAHPVELLRPKLPESLPNYRAPHVQNRSRITVTGLVITRQRPGTASGVIFLTLEDETDVVNVVVWDRVYQTFRKSVIAGRLVRVTGRIEREGPVIHLIRRDGRGCVAPADHLGASGDDRRERWSDG